MNCYQTKMDETITFKVHSWDPLERDDFFYIYTSGRTKTGESVSIRIDGFQPFIYVETGSGIINSIKAKYLFSRIVGMMKPETCPVSHKFIIKKKLQGNRQCYYMMLAFRAPSHYKTFAWNIAPKLHLKVHEHDIEPIIKFTAVRKLDMSGWLTVKTYIPSDMDPNESVSFSSADIDAYVKWNETRKEDIKEAILVKNVIASFDIECSSVNHNSKCPDATNSGNRAFQVAVTFARHGDDKENFEPYLLTMYDCPDVKKEYPNSTVLNYETEADLLVGFAKLIKNKDPDILVGWNTHKFDWPYMMTRSEMSGVFKRWMMMSRYDDFECEVYETTWSSSAYKKQIMKLPSIPGRFCLDLQIDVERNYKFDTYSLNNVAKQQLELEKEDVSPKQLFKLVDIARRTLGLRRLSNPTDTDVVKARNIVEGYINDEETTDETGATNILHDFRKAVRNMTSFTLKEILGRSIRYIGVYCIWDTYLPLMIMKGLETLEGLRQMSTITCVPMWYLQVRGQQIKVLAQVYRWTLWKNYVIAHRTKEDVEKAGKKYQGATVFDAKPNAYKKVATLDFASLYPSIIIASNICWTTLVREDSNIPEEACEVIKWTTHNSCIHDSNREENLKKAKAQAKRRAEDGKEPDVQSMILCGDYKYKWRKPKYNADGTVEGRGILPQMLQAILSERKAIKRKIAKHSLTLKLNSGNAKEGDVAYAKKIGINIKIGELSQENVEQIRLQLVVWDKYQLALKISANSVACDTPIPCKIHSIFHYLTIEELGNGEWIDDENGNQICPSREGLEVWSDVGFTKVKHVIRHPVDKPLKRVVTHTGIVDCTEDHSLLRDNGTEVKTTELEIGDTLMHKQVPLPKDTPSKPVFRALSDQSIRDYKLSEEILEEGITEELAFGWGLFFAEGTSGTWGILSKTKSAWIIYNQDLALLERAQSIFNKYEGDSVQFVIKDYRKSSSVYHLKPNGNIIKIVEKYRKLFYGPRRYKRVPLQILNTCFRIRQAFFIGYYSGDGNRNLSVGIVIQNKGAIGTASLAYLAKSLGYKVSVNNDKNNIYRLNCSTRFRNTKTYAIKKIIDAPSPPIIKSLKPFLFRNAVKIEVKNGICNYKGIDIRCVRIPRQKLLDRLDSVQELLSSTAKIIGYNTKTKRITCSCYECSEKTSVEMRRIYLNDTRPSFSCDCSPNINEEIELSPDINSIDSDTEYVYDVETVSHHFAAGIGDMIVHNSAYGGLGAKTSKLFLMEGAACVTARGRQLIQETASYTTENWACDLVYGDSVTGDTSVLVKKIDGNIDIVRISDVGKRWRNIKGKDYSRTRYDIESVWTESGWTRIESVMRHKTQKKMYRVLTHTGCVDVTEDHSLLDKFAKEIKPTDIKIGIELLHTVTFPEQVVDPHISEDMAFVYGLFMANGSCGHYDCPSEVKRSWTISKNNLELLEKAREIIGEDKCCILDVRKSSKVYKLVAKGDIIAFVDEYRPIFYDGIYKIVPELILNSSKNIKISFLNGYYAGDGDKTGPGTRMDIKGKLGAMGLFYIVRSIGYNVSINTRMDKPDIYRITFSNKTPRRNTLAVKKIYEIESSDDYVYDLTTSNHHFHAGVGAMIVHNTDSVLLSFRNTDVKESFRLSKECSERTTNHLKRWLIGVSDDEEISGEEKTMYDQLPIDLEFENMYGDFIIFTKKRYLATIIDSEGRVVGEQKKGVCTARRDNSHFLRNVYGKCARMALDDCPKHEILTMICEESMKLFTRQITPRELVVYKSIQDISDYKEGVKQPHLLLAIRMKKRGDEVPANTRMEYLVLWERGEDKKTILQGDKVEDYTYYRENYRRLNLITDNVFYVEQLQNPVQQLLDTKYRGNVVHYDDLNVAIFGKIHEIPITIQKSLHEIPRVRDKLSVLKKECLAKVEKVKDNKKYILMVELCDKYENAENEKEKEKILITIFGGVYRLRNDHKTVLKRLKSDERINYVLRNVSDPDLKRWCSRWKERELLKKLCHNFKTQYRLPHRPHPKKNYIVSEEYFVKNLALAHERHRAVVNQLRDLAGPFELIED